jgi:alanyl-tRNA synthetase
VTKLKSQIQSLKGQLADATQKLMEGKIAEIPLEQGDVILFERDLDPIVARNVVNKLVENHDGVCGVFVRNDTKGYSYILGSKSVDCREIAAMLREKLGARGGGSPQMVQGSVDRKEEEIRKILL